VIAISHIFLQCFGDQMLQMLVEVFHACKLRLSD
jgi:hypothetical protein